MYLSRDTQNKSARMAATSKLPNASVQTDKRPTPEINKRYVIHAGKSVCFEFIYPGVTFSSSMPFVLVFEFPGTRDTSPTYYNKGPIREDNPQNILSIDRKGRNVHTHFIAENHCNSKYVSILFEFERYSNVCSSVAGYYFPQK